MCRIAPGDTYIISLKYKFQVNSVSFNTFKTIPLSEETQKVSFHSLFFQFFFNFRGWNIANIPRLQKFSVILFVIHSMDMMLLEQLKQEAGKR